MNAREIMTNDPETITADEKITRAAQLMRERNVGILPVVDSRESMKLTGVVTDRDITLRHVAEGHGSDCPVREAMSSGDIQTVSPDDSTERVMELMREHQVRRIPVVENGGRLVGMIAQADLAVRHPDDQQVERTIEKISEPARPQ